MLRKLLFLFACIVTSVSTFADTGIVTLSPDPSEGIELHLTDDAAGKTFTLSSPCLTTYSGGMNATVLFYDSATDSYSESSSDYIDYSYSYTSNVGKLTLIPKKVTETPIKIKVKLVNKYNSTLNDISDVIELTINNAKRIPATLSVPSTFYTNRSGSATVTVPDYIYGTDYTVAFSSSNTNVIEIASDGTFTTKSIGNSTIKAIVTPTATGAASTFVAKTLTADINVKAAPTWAGTINITSLPLGVETTQSSDYPEVTAWSETISGASTKYTVISSDESVVKGLYNDSGQLVLASLKAGTANVYVKAEYGKIVWNGSANVWTTYESDTSESVAVTVASVTGSLTVTPSSDFTMELTSAKIVSYTATWSDSTTPNMGFEIEPADVVDGSWGDNGTIILTPLGTGTATVTVTSTWQNYLDTYSEYVTLEKAVSFNVTVYDKTLATSLTAPENVNVPQGKSIEVSVSYLPNTATFQDPTSNNEKVTAAYKTTGGTTDYSTLIVTVADDATVGGTANITLTPKAGSSAPAVTFIATVGKPELPVTDNGKNSLRVGENIESNFAIGSGLFLGTDYTVSRSVSDNKGTGDNSAISFDTETGNIKALNVGSAKITTTFTPVAGTTTADNYDAYTCEKIITVNPGEFGLSISATVDGTSATTAATTTLNDVAFTGSASDYTIEYSLEDAPSGVTINETTGAITGIPTSPTQFAVVATLTPTDATNYTGATAKTAILIKDTNAKVIISVDADGVYTVNVPSPGAFGVISDNPTTVTLNTGATLDGLKAATSIKVTGLLANSDVQELVNLIGAVCTNTNEYVKCETLDMGDATMTEAVTSNKDCKCSWVSTTNSKSLAGVKSWTLPKPAVGVEGGTILPSYTCSVICAWYTSSMNRLETLIVPEGWTETSSYFGANAMNNLTTLDLPNSLLKIGDYSFSDLKTIILVMPKNLEYIGAYAFNSSKKLEDIYFTGDGKALKYVDTTAFATQSQLCNNSVIDGSANEKNDPTISRYAYTNGGVLGCIMHFPEGCDAEYRDTTRTYHVVDTSVIPYP